MVERFLLVLGLVVAVVFSVIALGDSDHQESRCLMEAGEILPLPKILDHIKQERVGRVLEVELEHEHGHYVYEIELLSEEGKVWEYKIDAATGVVLEREPED